MADDLRLKIVVDALLNAEGFTQAQAELKNLGRVTEQVGEAQKVSTREIKVFTAELLQNIGMTHGAGAAGRVAAEGFLAMGSAVNLANLALAGGGLAAVTLLPKLIDLVKHLAAGGEDEAVKAAAEAAAKAADELRESIVKSLPELEHYTSRLQPIPGYLQGWLKAVRDLAVEDEAKQAGLLADQIEVLTGEMLKNKALLLDYHSINAAAGAGSGIAQSKIDALTVTIKDQEREIAALNARMREWAEAANKHLTVEGLRASKIKASTEATKDAAKIAAEEAKDLEAQWAAAVKLEQAQDVALEDEPKRVAALRARLQAQDQLARSYDTLSGKIATSLRHNQAEQDRDQKALDAWRNRWTRTLQQTGTLTAEQLQAMGDEYQVLADRIKKAGLEQQAAIAKMVSGALGALGEFFGKNKEIRIGQAIADTWAGVDIALATGVPPESWVTAGITLAKGMAAVSNIEKAGFDDPRNDALARAYGRQWAADMVREAGLGFGEGLRAMTGGGGSVTNVTNNRGLTIENLQMSGIVGVNETDLLKMLNRKLIAVQRLEKRSTLS